MSKKENTPELKNIKFEEALKKLEKIVQCLESGESSLEDSLALYEEGITLFRFCTSKLEEAKKKVEILTKKGNDGNWSPESLKLEKYGINNEKNDAGEDPDNESLPF